MAAYDEPEAQARGMPSDPRWHVGLVASLTLVSADAEINTAAIAEGVKEESCIRRAAMVRDGTIARAGYNSLH